MGSHILAILILAILAEVRWYLVVLICISLLVNDTEHFFMYLLPFVCLLWRGAYLDLLAIFKSDSFGFLLLSFQSSNLCQMYTLKIFSPILQVLSILHHLFPLYAEAFSLMQFHFSIFALVSCALGVLFKSSSTIPMS